MKRLNVKLALWLVGITAFSVIGVYFLHEYQEDRNAEFLKVQAEQARTAGNDDEAIKHYSQYVRHRDDREGYQALAELTVKVAKDPAATRQDHMRAYNLLEEAVRRYPDLDDARMSLIDYTMAMRRYGDALEHIKILQESGSKDTSLELKKASCQIGNGEIEAAKQKLFEMVGYDPATKQFAAEPPVTAKETDAFLLLAQMMRAKGEGADADAMISKMVEWNPDSAKAHLTRAGYLLAVSETVRQDTPEGKDLKAQLFSEANAELKRTAEIEPENPDAMLMIATIAMQQKDFVRAQELLDQALKLFPKRSDVYLRRSVLAFAQGDQQKAAAELQNGLEKVENTKPLLEQLVEIQFNLRDLRAARATCEKMKKVDGIPPEYIRYQEARLKMGDGKILEASRELEQVRPAMERLGGQGLNTVNTLLGRCYEILGLPDRQLEAYRRILSAYPNLLQARLGEASALQGLGRHSEAETSVKLLTEAVQSDPSQLPAVLQLAVNQELSKPSEERNWQQIDKLTALLETSGQQTPLQMKLLSAELLIAQGKSDEALAVLGGLRKEHPKEAAVWVALCKLMASDAKYRDRLPQLLSLAEKELGDVPALHVERIKIAARNGGEKAAEELQKLEAGIKSYEPAQQQALLALLSTAYLQTGDYENGKRCLKQVMASEQSNSRIRQGLFELALERRDEATMNELIKELRDSPYFGQQSPLYKYCVAAYNLQQFSLARPNPSAPLTDADRKKLSEIRKTADEAIALRGEWAPLWRVRGDVDLFEGNQTGAIANYQRSLNYSRAGQTGTARRLVSLLYNEKRFTEANEAMKYLEGTELPEDLRRLAEATKFQSGDAKGALEMAKRDIEKDPENPSNYVFYGQLLENNGENEAAEEAYRKAIAKGPKLAMAWEYLIRRLVANGKADEAKAAVKKAAELPDAAPLVVGRLYQRAGDTGEAEAQYKQALAKEPGSLLILRHLADLYLSEKKIDQAMPLLEKIIKEGVAASDPQSKAHAAWARSQKAQNFAPSQDYANTMEAVKMIEQSAPNGELSPNDMMTIVSILAPRLNEPPSRARAIELMEKLRTTQKLNAPQLIALARIYDRNGDWDKARENMLAALSAGDETPEACVLFAEMLYDHDALDEARRFTDRADELLKNTFAEPSSPVSQAMRLLRAKLLVKDGKQDEAAKVLENWLPRPVPQDKLHWLLEVAKETEVLGLNDAAERLFEEYAVLDPRGGKLALAAFRGRRGDLEQSFALLEEARESSPMLELLPVGLANARALPDKVTPDQFKKLNEWGQVALEQSKDPERLRMLIAELNDLQSRYDEVTKVYREMLADPKTSRITRAIVQNNLAFILAAINPTPQNGAEAQKLIEEAISVLGPTAELLDTRALTFLAQGKVDQAAADLRTAVEDRPSTSKYYHLAQVEKQLGNMDAAKTAFAKAQELHGEHNPFTPFERKGYEQLKGELN